MSAELLIGLVVVVIVLVAAALAGAYRTAHRLDRLHIRTDLARASLVGALGRRQTVAAAVVRDLAPRDPGSAQAVAGALDAVRRHTPDQVPGVDPAPDASRLPRVTRAGHDSRDRDVDGPGGAELAENRLGVALAGIDIRSLPEDLAAELDDVTDRVSMARRFYNDAVRDTRALRLRPTVRVLRLAGRAPMPDYVELVDAPPAGG